MDSTTGPLLEETTSLRVLQSSSHLLAILAETELERERANEGSVKHVKELNDDLAEYGRVMELESRVLNQFAALEDLIHQLAPYYGLDQKR